MLRVALAASVAAASAFGVQPGLLASARRLKGGQTSMSLGDFSATTIAGDEVGLSTFVGKPTLILNVASLWGTTVKDFTAMNALAAKFGDKLNILGFPCNQFGHQTNEGNEEFLNTLEFVRPGGGFKPAESITIFSKGDVNGADAMPVFKWLKSEIMIPVGDQSDTKGNGCADIDALILPRGGFGGTTVSLWTPVCRSDIAWNFEKFLVGPDGAVVQRYSRYHDTESIAEDIEKLL